jgi:hypothetical protein
MVMERKMTLLSQMKFNIINAMLMRLVCMRQEGKKKCFACGWEEHCPEHNS